MPEPRLQPLLMARLQPLLDFDECALVGRPRYRNVGDSAIWAGTVTLLHDLGIRIHPRPHARRPVLVQGGGNLGDLWPGFLAFFHRLVRHDRTPLIFLPQSICFRSDTALRQTAAVFNAHPNLTLIAREQVSFDLATSHFTSCRIHMAPDMAFYLEDRIQPVPRAAGPAMLLLGRSDRECLPPLSAAARQLPGIEPADWVTHRPLHLLTRLFSRRPAPPLGLEKVERWNRMTLKDGLMQLASTARLVVTDRLHGHILSTLLGLPNVLLANAYHKNASFFRTWTHSVPICRFVDHPSQLNAAVAELLCD